MSTIGTATHAARRKAEFGDELLDPKEAGAFLKVSLSWLAKARAANDGPPFVRIGRCVRYSKAALLRWLNSREQ